MDFYALEGASGNWGQRAGVREWSLGEELNRSWSWGRGAGADQAVPVGTPSHPILPNAPPLQSGPQHPSLPASWQAE